MRRQKFGPRNGRGGHCRRVHRFRLFRARARRSIISYSLKDEAGYIREIRALQKEYAGRIRLYCGLEQDYFAPTQRRESYDYIIGSVHYWRDEASGRYWAVDGSPETVADCRDTLFGGDARKMVEAYYALVADNCETYRPDIAGHLDVVGKEQPRYALFR